MLRCYCFENRLQNFLGNHYQYTHRSTHNVFKRRVVAITSYSLRAHHHPIDKYLHISAQTLVNILPNIWRVFFFAKRFDFPPSKERAMCLACVCLFVFFRTRAFCENRSSLFLGCERTILIDYMMVVENSSVFHFELFSSENYIVERACAC